MSVKERNVSISEMADVLIETINQTDPEATKYTAQETLEFAAKAAHTMMDRAFNAEPNKENKNKFEFYQLVAGELHRRALGMMD